MLALFNQAGLGKRNRRCEDIVLQLCLMFVYVDVLCGIGKLGASCEVDLMLELRMRL